MEVVNVGTVSVDEAIELLLEPANLQKLVGWHGALCFALVREMTAPDFYGRLIENVATIDSTTRDHIAFIVFYGERSSITHRAGTSYRPYLARYQVQGFSVSNDQDVHFETKHDLPRIQPEFDPQLGQYFRDSPSKVHRPTLSQKMGHAIWCLMKRYSVPEHALPCLLFVDASDSTRSTIVRLSTKDPLSSLYNDVLRPMSQEFAELSRFWKRRDEIKANRYSLEQAKSELRELPGKLSECNDRLKRASENATTDVPRYSSELDQWKKIAEAIDGLYDDPLVCAKIEHHPVAWQVIGKLRSYQNRLAEAKTIEESLLLVSQQKALSSAQLSLERVKLGKRLGSIRASIKSRFTNITSFVRDNIWRLEQTISRARSELNSATWDEKTLERRLDEANAFLRKHSSATLDEDERLLIDVDKSLRIRGYGDDVLVDSSPAAFSVIKSLQDRKHLGANEPDQDSRGRDTMRILFLAANPSQTLPLDLEEELRSLEQELRGVKFRDSITRAIALCGGLTGGGAPG